ncbi:MAG: amidinotransferase, partial [Longispora sp.]|nr:amidinotransferase [Longispora sp. (in: high G+C Gram-positive bacteria)]
PEAFSPGSREILAGLFPNALLVSASDAAVFGLNSVSDGHNIVVLPAAKQLIADLTERGYNPITVELSELMKAGGGPKCCTLEVRK